jgi:hypothetical protein
MTRRDYGGSTLTLLHKRKPTSWSKIEGIKNLKVHDVRMGVFACREGTRGTNSKLKQEVIACACEHWLEFGGHVTGLIGS